MNKKNILAKIDYWLWFITSGLLVIAIGSNSLAFENIGQWLIAVLISLFMFLWAGDRK